MQSKKINELGTSLSPSVSDLTVVGDATTGQLKKITLSQIAALFGSSGSVSSITTTAPLTGGTITTSGTLGITQATTSANGYLTSTDFNTFNGKQAALSGTGFIKISGTTVSYDNSSYYLASNPSSFITLSSLSGSTGISYNSSTGVITSTITQYTDTLARMSLSFTAGSGAYNNGTGVITIPTNNNQITNGAGYITSSALSSYLPLSGGTLTGALSGTSATLSSTLRVNGGTTTIYGSTATLNLNTIPDGEQTTGYFTSSGNGAILGSPGSIYLQAGSTTVLTIDDYHNFPSGTTNSLGNVIISTSVAQGADIGAGLCLGGWSTSTGTTTIFGRVYGRKENSTSGNNAGYLAFETASASPNQSYERMRITSGGNIGIGTTIPTTYSLAGKHLELFGGSDFSFFHCNTTTVKSFFATNESSLLSSLFTFSAHPLTFGTSNTERMRITSGGQVYAGTTGGLNGTLNSTTLSGLYALTLYDGFGNSAMASIRNSSNTQVGSITIVSGTSTAYNTTSDYRLKEDFKEIKGLEKVLQIKVYDFKWKSGEYRMDGVIAHELSEVIPYAVVGEKDAEEMQSVDYSKLVPILIKAVQEQQATITSLQSQINELK